MNFNEKEGNMRRGELLRKRKWKGSEWEGWREAGVQAYLISSKTLAIKENLNGKEKEKFYYYGRIEGGKCLHFC